MAKTLWTLLGSTELVTFMVILQVNRANHLLFRPVITTTLTSKRWRLANSAVVVLQNLTLHINTDLLRGSYVVVYCRVCRKLCHGNGDRLHKRIWPTLVGLLDHLWIKWFTFLLFRWWGLIVAIILASIFLPFVVTVYAITGMFIYDYWTKVGGLMSRRFRSG